MSPPARWGDQDGAVTIFVVGLSLALLMLAGLLFDGGRILAARREAFATADNAARAGAQAVDLEAMRAGAPPQLDPAAARDRARDYLQRHSRQPGQIRVDGDRVQVRVQIDVPLALLSALGLDTQTVTGTGQAHAVQGVTTPNTGA